MKKRLWLSASLLLMSVYFGICGVLYIQQRDMLFPAPISNAAPVKRLTNEGPVVVYFHGNGMTAGDTAPLAEALKTNFVAIEYPGYGILPGQPSENSIYDASEQQLRDLPKSRLILVGESLGTGPAIEMARRGWGSKLVLITPFTSIPDVAQKSFPYLPIRWLAKDIFDNAGKVTSITQPILIVHGDEDDVVPFEHGKQLHASLSGAQMLTVPGGHHNDLWKRPEVVERIRSFVAQ